MSERLRLLLLAALLGTPAVTRPQTLEELRARSKSADSAMAVAVERQRKLNEFGQFDGDAEIRSGGRVVRFRSEEITTRDSARIARGLELGRARLIARYGDAGAALIDTATWAVTRDRRKLFGVATLYMQRDPNGARADLSRPISATAVADFVFSQAGDRLVANTPALRGYAGWSAFLPERIRSAEIARLLATSWAAVGRRCAARAAAACAVVLSPFDAKAGFDRYFDASDMRAVVTAARLPGLPDSSFSEGRRQCLKGDDSACARIIDDVVPADPYNSFLRGSLLAHAIALGGNDALARLAAERDSAPIAMLARVAGLSEEALLESWHDKVFSAVTGGLAGAIPAVLSTVAWCALLIFVSLRRRFL